MTPIQRLQLDDGLQVILCNCNIAVVIKGSRRSHDRRDHLGIELKACYFLLAYIVAPRII